MRPLIHYFAECMEKELSRNDHKGGWQSDRWESLFDRLREEVEELRVELIKHEKAPRAKLVLREAADVANFAMMLADIASGVPWPEQGRRDQYASSSRSAGDGGQASAGEKGCIVVQYYDAKSDRYRVAVGYVGEDGIQPYTVYVVDDGKLVVAPNAKHLEPAKGPCDDAGAGRAEERAAVVAKLRERAVVWHGRDIQLEAELFELANCFERGEHVPGSVNGAQGG